MNLQILNPLQWSKSFIVLVMGAFIFIWFAIFDTYSLWARYQLNQRQETLKTKTEHLETETQQLKQKIENLSKEPALLERIAREEYGMKKEGEFIYKIKEKD
jgi:cell division protein FtsL